MTEFEYGPVDLYVIGFEADRLSRGTLEAIGELVAAGDIRLLDALLVTREADGDLRVVEFEDLGDELDVTGIDLEASGLVGDDDLEDLAAAIKPGSSAALLAVELLWAKKLASRFAASGGTVLQIERIPAQIVNEVLSDAEDEE